MTCKTCRHWDLEDAKSRSPQFLGMGFCDSAFFHEGYSAPSAEIRERGIWMENDEGWACATGPAFGCVHWEAKADAPA